LQRLGLVEFCRWERIGRVVKCHACIAAGLNCAAGRLLDWEEVVRTVLWWGREMYG